MDGSARFSGNIHRLRVNLNRFPFEIFNIGSPEDFDKFFFPHRPEQNPGRHSLRQAIQPKAPSLDRFLGLLVSDFFLGNVADRHFEGFGSYIIPMQILAIQKAQTRTNLGFRRFGHLPGFFGIAQILEDLICASNQRAEGSDTGSAGFAGCCTTCTEF